MQCNHPSSRTHWGQTVGCLPQVLAKSRFVTDDPVKADLFLVPAQLYCNDLENYGVMRLFCPHNFRATFGIVLHVCCMLPVERIPQDEP